MSFFKGDAAKTNAPSFFGAGSAKNSGTSASQSTSAFSQVSQSMTSFLSNFPPEIYKKCQSSYSSNSNNEEEDIESMATDDNDDVLSDSDSVESDTRDNLDDFGKNRVAETCMKRSLIFSIIYDSIDDSYNPRHDQQATEEVQVNDETQDIHKTEDSQSPFPTDTSSSNVDMRAPTSLSSTPVPIQAAKIDNFAIPGTPMRRPRITTTTTSRLRVMPLPNPSLKKSDAVEHTIKPKETLNPVVAMNQIIVSPPSQRRVMNRKSKNGKDDELQQQQHQQQQQQKQHYLQHQVELPAEREQQRKEHCVTDARSADLSHDHHSHIGNQEACSHQHSQYCVDPKDADGTRSSDSGSSSSRSGGSSRQQHVTLQSSRASDLSFDHLQQKLGDLEMAIKTGKLAVVREREGIGEKEQELCLQKNRYYILRSPTNDNLLMYTLFIYYFICAAQHTNTSYTKIWRCF